MKYVVELKNVLIVEADSEEDAVDMVKREDYEVEYSVIGKPKKIERTRNERDSKQGVLYVVR